MQNSRGSRDQGGIRRKTDGKLVYLEGIELMVWVVGAREKNKSQKTWGPLDFECFFYPNKNGMLLDHFKQWGVYNQIYCLK